MTYQDVLATPTCERRFFLMKLINDNQQQREATEEQQAKVNNKGARGTRTTKMGGEQLKAKMKSGEIAN